MVSKSRARLLTLFEDLESAVEEFNAVWPNHVRHAELYQLPVLTEQAVPERIEPQLLVDDQAVRMAQYAYRAFALEPNQHPATAARFPGVLIVDQPLNEYIEAINTIKDQIRALMAQHPQSTRTYIARQTLPGIVMLHLYRRIHTASNLRRILWTWAGNTTGNRNVTVEQAAEQIEASRPYPPAHISHEAWNALIDSELRKLGQLGASPRLLFRRRVAPHPRVTTYSLNEDAGHSVYKGNLPLVVYAPMGEALPEITPLKDYIEGVRTALRRDRQRLVPVIQRVHLYARPPQ